MSANHPSKVFEFGPFRLTAEDGTLTRAGQKVPLPLKAADVLLLLVASAPRLVSKKEMFDAVWPQTTVTPETLNYYIHLIREALQPGLNREAIETVRGRGFRFVLPVTTLSPTVATLLPPVTPGRSRPRIILVAGVAMLLLGTAGYWLAFPQPADIRVAETTQLTHDREPKLREPLFTDGQQVFYRNEAPQPRFVSVHGGDPRPVFHEPTRYLLLDVSRVRPEYLALRLGEGGGPDGVWVLPQGHDDVPRQIPSIDCRSAAWSPDAARIACASPAGLWVVDRDGNNRRQILLPELGVAVWPHWSPDGGRLRFTFITTGDQESPTESLWEVRADGLALKPLLPGWNGGVSNCCGNWDSSGRYFFFEAVREGRRDLWVLPEPRGLFGVAQKPVRISDGTRSFSGPVVSPDGRTVFAIGGQDLGEMVRLDAKEHAPVPTLGGLSATWVSFSPDHQSIVYVSYPDTQVWRSRVDGTDRRQLTFGSSTVDGTMWSPDGTTIAFRSSKDGKHMKVYLMPADGGEPRPLIQEDREQGIASWSKEGDRLVYGDVPARFGEGTGQETLTIYDVVRRQASVVPGSSGLWTARWSPDGRYIAALTTDKHQSLKVLDVLTGKWREVAADHIRTPNWSHDSQFIYYDTEGVVRCLRRVRLSDGKVEDLMDLSHYQVAAYWWSGLTPDDSPMILRNLSATEVYALRLEIR